MKRVTSFVVVLLLVSGLTGGAEEGVAPSEGTQVAAAQRPSSEDRYIVVLRDSEADPAAVAREHSRRHALR